MGKKEMLALGAQLRALLQEGQVEKAYSRLAPILAERTPFPLLELLGQAIPHEKVSISEAFLEEIAAHGTEGGWVVIASALRECLQADLARAFNWAHKYILQADVWYAADIFGERVPGPALLLYFDQALSFLALWREDSSPWIRRTVGVAVHFWAKRTRGAPEFWPQARALLNLLDPLFEEHELAAVKGIGWGLKTVGRYYPALLIGWLEEQLWQRHRHPRALMLRKALTYLPPAQRGPLEEALAR